LIFTLSRHRYIGSEWRKTGATVFAEENISFFDYIHDNNFCLVVSLPVIFIGMLVIKYCFFNFLKKPCYGLCDV